MLSLVLLAALAVTPTTGNLVVSCDKPFALYIDGQQVNPGELRTSWTAHELNAGRHDVRVEAWPNPFRREQLAAGVVDVPGGSEVRMRAEKDRLVVYETISLLAPPVQEVVAVAPANVQLTVSAPAQPTLVVTAPMPQVVVETSYSDEQVVTYEEHHQGRRDERGHHDRHGDHGRGYAMRPSDFAALRGAVANEAFENKKLDVLRTAAAANYFTVDQVGQLVDLFTFSNGKVDAVQICRPHIVDMQNAFQLYGHFTFEADKRRVRGILGQ